MFNLSQASSSTVGPTDTKTRIGDPHHMGQRHRPGFETCPASVSQVVKAQSILEGGIGQKLNTGKSNLLGKAETSTQGGLNWLKLAEPDSQAGPDVSQAQSTEPYSKFGLFRMVQLRCESFEFLGNNRLGNET